MDLGYIQTFHRITKLQPVNGFAAETGLLPTGSPGTPRGRPWIR
jgi:hypothetical protein